MNILFQKFPDSVSVHGKRYRIETDFREWIKLYELFEQTEKFNRQILDIILDWYEVIPADEIAAVRALEKFMAGAPIPEPAAGDGKGSEKQKRQRRNRKPVFSFTQDAVQIYSAFLAVYGIDIETVPYMHWWKFLILFEGLPENTEIKERIYYRSVDLKDIKSKEERKRIAEIKKRIELRNPARKLDAYQIGDVFA